MLGLTFGIKQAEAASHFATTPEQRTMVMAVLKALGVKFVLKEKVARRIARNDATTKNNEVRIKKILKKADVLNVQADNIGLHTNEAYEDISNMQSLANHWS